MYNIVGDIMLIGNLNFRNALRQALIINPNEDAFFDFSKTFEYSPFAMLFMASVLRNKKKENDNVKFVLSYNKNLESTSYAGHMGFFKSISTKLSIGKNPGEARGSRNYLPVTKIDFQEDFQKEENIQEAIEKKSITLSKVLTQDEELYKTFAFIIREMLRNSIEHSKDHCVWICAQYWPSYEIAEIAILDNGIGIRESLSSNYNYSSKITDDEAALKMALLPGITESYGKIQSDEIWSNSGYGLYMASNLCSKLDGTFLLVSNSKALFLYDNKQEIIDTKHKGTAIRMTLKTNKKFNYDEIRNEVLCEATKIASKIEKAVKKPSKSSGGLTQFIN